MAKLTSGTRSALPAKDFAGPGRTYPDENKAHAVAAKGRATQFATPAVKAQVDRAVARKYPDLGKKK